MWVHLRLRDMVRVDVSTGTVSCQTSTISGMGSKSPSQQSQSILSSRVATVISKSLMYVRITCQGVVNGLPRRSFHLASHSFLTVARAVADRSFLMYCSKQMAVASISQFFATCPTRLHAAHWTSNRKGHRLLSSLGRPHCCRGGTLPWGSSLRLLLWPWRGQSSFP